MTKNIVICLDGTGNQLKAKGNTNVLTVFEMLDLSDPARQIGYYDPGVGTFSSRAAWTSLARRISRLGGLAFGSGQRTNLAEAYTYLMNTWEPGDKVFVFGFSRGAYTARALSGMLRLVGLMRRSSENLVPYAMTAYTRSAKYTADDWKQIHHFARTFARDAGGGRTGVPIEFMGIWDTVKAAGILRWDLHWPYTRQMPNVRAVRHAVSIDEKRRPFHEYLVEAPEHEPAAGPPAIDEVWFAGVHSDVGGTFDDDPRLPQISLKWMVEGARDAGIVLRAGAYEKACAVTAANAVEGKIHTMGRIWAVLTYRHRPVPGGAKVHASVEARRAATGYGRKSIPATVAFVDPTWADLRP
ncbi:MAG: hypothetical protein JWN61_2193 [Pseudonocardiales bacterium]|nr:hypothetical protein [Pseudonocardiales bacterium]